MSLTVVLPGSIMVSKQECLKQLKEEVKDKKGNVIRDKEGNIKYRYKTIPDPEKHEVHHSKFLDGKKKEIVHFYTRKCIPVKQVINISSVAYNYFISTEVPEAFEVPANFPVSLKSKLWKLLSKEQRLRWHCGRIADTLGGRVESFIVFPD